MIQGGYDAMGMAKGRNRRDTVSVLEQVVDE